MILSRRTTFKAAAALIAAQTIPAISEVSAADAKLADLATILRSLPHLSQGELYELALVPGVLGCALMDAGAPRNLTAVEAVAAGFITADAVARAIVRGQPR